VKKQRYCLVGRVSAYREDRKQVSLETKIRGDEEKRERARKKIKLTWDQKEKRRKWGRKGMMFGREMVLTLLCGSCESGRSLSNR